MTGVTQVVTNDPMANTATAWSVGTRGTLTLDPYADFVGLVHPPVRMIAVVRGAEGPVSQYPPGAALLAAPIYAISGGELDYHVIDILDGRSLGIPPVWPASLAASAATAAASAVLFLTLTHLGTRSAAMIGALVLALATSAWAVASQVLWQHGPAMMWIAIGVLAAARARPRLGLSWAGAILTRPPTALIGGTLTAYEAWRGRSWKRLLGGVGLGIGVLVLSWFNLKLFGEFSVMGGYSRTTIGLANPGRPPLLANFYGAFFDSERGLITYSPYLLLLLPGLGSAWKEAPDWARGAAIGGILYLVVQFVANRFSGGNAFFAYRYPLEGLIAMAPLLYVSYQEWTSKTRVRAGVFWVAVVFAATLQALAVLRFLHYR